MGWTLQDNESINSLAEEAAQDPTRNTAYSESLYDLQE